MTNTRNPAIARAASRVQKITRRWPVTLSNSLGDTTPGFSAAVPGEPGMVYCVMPDGSVLKAYNARVAAGTGLRVWSGYEPHNPTFFRILDFNVSYIAPPGGGTGGGTGAHHWMHEWLNPAGGLDVVYSQARQLMPLRLSVLSGLVVRVEPSPIWTAAGWALSTTATLDLAAHVPAAGARYVLVYLDAAGALSARSGVISPGLLPYSAIPAAGPGEYALAGVRLAAGQTTITETPATQDVVDLRFAMAGGRGVDADVIWDALGDLAVGTGPDTADRLAAGADGEILSANSAEPTGLEWISAPSGDVATDTLWDAKGDLAVGTGADTAARLAVGANGKILSADSGEATGLKWITAPGGGSLPWFNVMDYGAVGDGTTNDTAAVTAAIAAIPATGGVLYFPAGVYKTTGGFTLADPVTVLGDGRANNYGADAVSQVNCTSQTAVLFTVTATVASFQSIALKNTYAGTPSAGAGIQVSGTDIGQRVDYENVSVFGFYIDIDVQVGAQWVMHACQIMGPVLYGVKIRNTVNGDAGDWSIDQCNFNADVYNSTAAVRIESSGGGKISNCKFNDGFDAAGTAFAHPIDVSLAAATSILLIANNSIENFGTNGIRFVNNGNAYAMITITGNQINNGGGSGYAITMTATTVGQVHDIIIADNHFLATPTPAHPPVLLTKMDNVYLGENIPVGWPSGAFFTQSGCLRIYEEAFEANSLTSTYTTAAINLGTTTDGGWVDVDATNAKITISNPRSDGQYRASFDFSHYFKANELDVAFRLTDGTTHSNAVESYEKRTTAERVIPVHLEKIFTWTSQAAKTVKLQKWVATATTVTTNQISIAAGFNIGLYMQLHRIGSG